MYTTSVLYHALRLLGTYKCAQRIFRLALFARGAIALLYKYNCTCIWHANNAHTAHKICTTCNTYILYIKRMFLIKFAQVQKCYI